MGLTRSSTQIFRRAQSFPATTTILCHHLRWISNTMPVQSLLAIPIMMPTPLRRPMLLIPLNTHVTCTITGSQTCVILVVLRADLLHPHLLLHLYGGRVQGHENLFHLLHYHHLNWRTSRSQSSSTHLLSPQVCQKAWVLLV